MLHQLAMVNYYHLTHPGKFIGDRCPVSPVI